MTNMMAFPEHLGLVEYPICISFVSSVNAMANTLA